MTSGVSYVMGKRMGYVGPKFALSKRYAKRFHTHMAAESAIERIVTATGARSLYVGQEIQDGEFAFYVLFDSEEMPQLTFYLTNEDTS